MKHDTNNMIQTAVRKESKRFLSAHMSGILLLDVS